MTKEQATEEIRREHMQAGGDSDASMTELIQFSKIQTQKVPHGSDEYRARMDRYEALTAKSN